MDDGAYGPSRATVFRALLTLAVVAALAAPTAIGRDSFPLSTYPMYASARGPTARLVSAVGVGADGESQPLSLGVIGRSDDPLIVETLLRRSIDADGGRALCAEIAARVPDDATVDDGELVEVWIVTDRRHLADTVRRPDGPPLERTIHARCPTEAGT